MVDLIDLARNAGAENVGLARVKEAGPAPINAVMQGSGERGVFPGSPQVKGPMSVQMADRGVAAAMPKFRACYEEALASDPKLTGVLSVQLTIAPDGTQYQPYKLHNVAFTNGDDKALTKCVTQFIPSLVFPKLASEDRGAIVLFPLLFSP